MLKSKINYKNPLAKSYNQNYESKQSLTLSTNESKIMHSNQKSNLNSQVIFNEKILIDRNLRKYGTSNSWYYLANFKESFEQTRTRQKILLKDQNFNNQDQIIQKYYTLKKSMQEMQSLAEYYKYYINNPILFNKDHFKIVYNFYERNKYLQYKKLKAILNLSDERTQCQNSINQNISVQARGSQKSNSNTFYIMNMLDTQFNKSRNQISQSQSKAFVELNNHLQFFSKKKKQEAITKQFLQSKQSTKKKKVESSNISSPIHKLSKKKKKQYFNNSNSSLKKAKSKNKQKELSPFRYNITKNPKNINRRKSNFSMDEFKTNDFEFISQKFSPKKYQKKRFNSCETVIHRTDSKQKYINKKNKKSTLLKKSKLEKCQERQLSDFQQYIKKLKLSSIKSNNQSNCVRKNKKEPIPQGSTSNIRKVVKKKRQNNSQSSKVSLQKSQKSMKKQTFLEQNISNLKKKIKLAKQTIRNAHTNNVSNKNIHKLNHNLK